MDICIKTTVCIKSDDVGQLLFNNNVLNKWKAQNRLHTVKLSSSTRSISSPSQSRYGPQNRAERNSGFIKKPTEIADRLSSHAAIDVLPRC